MIERFRRFYEAAGLYNTIAFLLPVVYLIWMLARNGWTSSSMIIFVMFLCALLAPRVILRMLLANSNATLKWLGVVQYILIAYLLLRLFNAITPPPLVGLGILLAFGLWLGANFWFNSDPYHYGGEIAKILAGMELAAQKQHELESTDPEAYGPHGEIPVNPTRRE